MLAAVFRSGQFVLDEIAEPVLRGGQLLIEVEATGICGSDLSAARYTDQFLQSARDSGTALYSFDPAHDLVFGHEYAGRVIAVGDGVHDFAAGDRVAGIAIVLDEAGEARLCGYSNEFTGGFAERMVVQADFARKIPDTLSTEFATLAEPLSVGETSVQRSAIDPEQGAVVFGSGAVGLGVIAALAAREVKNLVVVEPSPERRARAIRMGASKAIHPDEADPVAVWRSAAGREASLVAWECTGKPGVLNHIMYAVPPHTRIMVDGSCMTDDVIRPVVGTYKGLLIDFGFGAAERAYDISLARLASQQINAAEFVTGEVGLDRVGEAFKWLSTPQDHVKILVRPALTGVVDR